MKRKDSTDSRSLASGTLIDVLTEFTIQLQHLTSGVLTCTELLLVFH